MHPLLDRPTALRQALLADPLYRLAWLSVWLDPLGGREAEPDDALLQALFIARECFPDLYAHAVQALHQGTSATQLERAICQYLTAYGIPIDYLDGIVYGIPLPAYGCCLFSEEEDALPAVLLPLLTAFGVDQDELTYPDEAPELAWMVMEGLHALPSPLAHSLGWMVGWLWGITGNVCVDLEDELLNEYDPLPWTHEGVAHARALIAEAHTLMEEVQAGCDALTHRPDLLSALETAVQTAHTLYHTTALPKGTRTAHDPALRSLARRLRLDARAFTADLE